MANECCCHNRIVIVTEVDGIIVRVLAVALLSVFLVKSSWHERAAILALYSLLYGVQVVFACLESTALRGIRRARSCSI